jgi:RHS repeat-associated protein
MRRIVPALRRVIVLLLVLTVSVLGTVVRDAPPAQAAAGDPVSYAYDDAGRLVGATDPSGDTAKYRYDPVGNLTSIDRQPSSQVAILAFSPGRGPAGTTVTISGTGFSGTASANTVKFNGTTATVSSATTTRLVATVPAGATSGPISVTTPGGSGTSSDPFTVGASKAPTITGFSPTAGTAGSAVTITGTNFAPDAADNQVTFNQTRGRVTAATSTSLTVEVPGAAGSGPISVRTPDGSARSSDDFIIPPSPSVPADVEVSGRITVGAAKTFAITTAGKIALQLFDGTAGQRVSVLISNATCCSNAGTLALVKPDGSTLVANNSLATTTFLDQVALPVDGTYSVLVNPDADRTGSFTLTVYSVTDVTGTVAADGSVTSFTLSTPGQDARYSLAGSAGQRVSVRITNATCCSNAGTLALLKPDGSTLVANNSLATTTFLDQVALPVDGTYTVLVSPDSNRTGSFSLAVYSVSDVTGTIAANGSATSFSLTTPGQNARYSLAGTAGQRVSVLISNATCCSNAGTLALLQPDGSTLVANNSLATTTFLDQVALPVDGTYTVLVNPDSDRTGSFTLTVYTVSDVTGTVAADGSSRSFSLTTPGQNARYSLAGTAGQRVSVLITNATCCSNAGTLALLKPDGSTLVANNSLATTTFLDQVALPVDGTYTVLISPDSDRTGSFTLAVYTATEVTGTIAADGSSTSFSLANPGQNARYSFSGSANQQVNLSLTNSTIGGSNSCTSSNGTLAILKPDGSTLGSTSMCKPTTNLATQTLPVSGTYTALVNPASTNTGSASVKLSTVTTLAAAKGATTIREPSPAPTSTTRVDSRSTDGEDHPTRRPDSGAASDRTASEPAPAQAASDSPEEAWAPDRLQLRGDPWLTRRPTGVWERLSPLMAPPGITAVAGHTLTLDGQPLARVTLRLEDRTAVSDDSGRFLLTGVPAGHHVLVVDGRSASSTRRAFGVFEIGVDLAEGKTTALPATIWMPRLDTIHTERFASPTTGEVVLTTPRIPGLEVRVPAGSTIRDTDGKVVKELGITAIPVDRPPFPLPADVQVPIYFTVQPGGAYIFPEGARIIYPNYTHEAPGTRVNFWSYDPEAKGWHIYGKGTVTADANQVVPDPGVRVYAFTGAMINVSGLVAAAIGAIKDAFAAISGDPVDLGTGLFINSHTDLALADTLPIAITRTYRQSDTRSRPFGIGTNFDYGMFLQSANQYQEADLVLPDSAKIHYVRISSGTGFTTAVFEAQNSPTAFYKSKIAWNGNGWDLTLRDGTVYVFGENQPLQSIRDRYGNQVKLTRTSGQAGNITQITSPTGKWIKLSYDTGNRITRAEDSLGRVVTYTYDTGGRLIQVTGPAASNITKYAYNASHQLTTITDARDVPYLTNVYDANGRIQKQTQADQTTYQFAYTVDGNGKVTQTQVTDPRGQLRKVTFDAGGFLVTDTAAFGTPQAQTTTLERQPGTNFVTAMTDQLGRRTSLGYDPNGNVTSVTQLAGTAGAQTVSSVYGGPFNQVSEITDPLNHKTTFSYDSRGNLTTLKDPLNRETTFTYNGAGQPTSTKNGLDHTTRFTYEFGDLIAVQDPLGRTTRQFVDAAGRVRSVTDPTGATSRVSYDALNQVTQVEDPLGNTTSFTYDANGNLLTVKDARDKVTTYTYDQMDRVKTLKDPLGKTQSYDYDANGNLATFTSRRGKVTSSSYDPLDRLTQVKYGVTGGSAESTVDYSWDAGNRLTQIDDSAGGTITYTPDNLDRLTTETSPQGSVGYGYDAADRLTSMTVAGQPQVSYGYNNADQPTTITQGSQSVSVGYDSVGRPTILNLPGGVSETYGLDDADQPTSIAYKQGTTTLGDLTYGYDQAGRRATMGGSFARIAIPTAFSSASYNDNNQLTSRAGVSYSYDDDGNLTGDGTTSYSWNARGQLTGLTRTGLSAAFAYDATGRRKSKTINGTITGYLHDGANPTQELSGTTPMANLLTGGIDQSFTRSDPTGQRSFLTDALGSTVALTDQAGAVKTSYTYEPFGKTTATGEANANPQRYTGREDDGTGLYYYRARYYHPGLQRFISEDPTGFSAGDTNLYAYVGNNPTNLTDPSGENPAAAAAGRAVSTCLVNATISGGIDFLRQRLAGRKVNWGSGGVGGAALYGCLLGPGGKLLRSARLFPEREVGNHTVYVLMSRGSPVYVGITHSWRFALRESEHRAMFAGQFNRMEPLITDVTKTQARAIETHLLQLYKDPYLYLNNADRSMSLPIYRARFKAWVEDLISSWFTYG